MGNEMIRRHSLPAIVMHWFNAGCWLFLLTSGVGLIDNEQLQPISMWVPKFMNSLFGGGENLLLLHWICGLVWAITYVLYAIFFIRSGTIPFIKEIFSFSFKRDFLWLVKKGVGMTLGDKALAKMGLDAELPSQGFYNVGQKLFGITALFGSIVIAITGLLMTSPKLELVSLATIQWCILIHYLAVGLVFAGLLIHIFMAAIAKGELPALVSMFTGSVTEDHAKHLHKCWYDDVVREGEKSIYIE